MRILFACQFYAPSVGGVQEVIRQIAERLVLRGHQVTVVTTTLPMRDLKTINGVAIEEFAISGNYVSGMNGDVKAYQEYVCGGEFDVIMIYAAQQWTFDALWPVMNEITFSKVFVPCGFSGLYEPGYKKYFQEIPCVLKQFDHIIFHASKYRDIDFVRELGIENFSIVSNGASEIEFDIDADPLFRFRNGIPEKSFVFLTVGSFTGLKGHQQLFDAFSRMNVPENQHVTLLLNGNHVERLERGFDGLLNKLIGFSKTHGLLYLLCQVAKKIIGLTGSSENFRNFLNSQKTNKMILVTDFPRSELVQAFISSDLFVFASNIEYSPLVLFESAAAGTPFLTVDVGNAIEIAKWTGAGVLCPSIIDSKGYTRVNECVLAKSMSDLMLQRDFLQNIGAAGKRNWKERFTWMKVTDQYERILKISTTIKHLKNSFH